MFEFDPAKSEANRAKHGIDFEEAQALWQDADRFELPSRKEGDEERWLIVGTIAGKMWTAIVTYREGVPRLISCRRSRRKEERLYEQA